MTALKGEAVRDKIIESGLSGAEATDFFMGNLTEEIQDFKKLLQDGGKAGVTLDCAKRLGSAVFKAIKDYGRGDPLCGTLCTVSATCEVVSCVLTLLPIPEQMGQMTSVALIKGTSISCQKFRDLWVLKGCV